MRLILVCALALSACSSSWSPSDPTKLPSHALVAARPYDIDVPAGYDGNTALPLIVLLHGFGINGYTQDAYFGFNTLADQRHVFVAHPDGTLNSMGMRFWNATDACCDMEHTGVDDVAYLNAVIDDVEAQYHVDTHHVFFVGHSNGGFMSHRMACDATARIAAIAALAGDVWKDASRCNPSAPIAVLQVHGDADTVVPYAGDAVEPSAPDSVATWAAKNGCAGGLVPTGATLDLDTQLPGAETEVARWSCPAGAAELWTIHGGSHVPSFAIPDWGDHLFDWLMQYSR